MRLGRGAATELVAFARNRFALAGVSIVLGLIFGLLPAPALAAFDPEYEQRNYSKINERAQHEHLTPEYRALLAQQSADDETERAQIRLEDPERDFDGNLCSKHQDGCAGDVRLYRWDESGFGINVPVLYVARSGAIISGHVWATRDGPPVRPAVVITTGSIQAPEELYLFMATTLAKRGYVVLTYDVQGQGRSDTFGEEPDRNEGVPAQQAANFINGTEDALRFLQSTPASPYVPAASDTTGTVHDARQDRRVAEGRNAPYNPLHFMLDASRIGIIGHSLGATAVSTVCCANAAGRQPNPVVDAVVAWDNLTTSGGIVPRVPALGMSADYGLTPTPYTSEPDPQGKNGASNAYSAAGVDTAQINIRGGTHYEWSYIPNPGFGATLRGMDMAAWYTAAWLDKYVKGDATADARLLTNRWRADEDEAAVDPDGDGNQFSRYFRSRIDIGLASGGRVKCEDLRELQDSAPGQSCTSAVVADDGEPPNYSYLNEARSADPGAYPRPGGGTPLRVPLVPRYAACTAPNATHAAPLALPSCRAPALESGLLTTSSHGRGTAFVRLDAVLGDPATVADEADIAIAVSATDVVEAATDDDFGGEALLEATIRLADRSNRFLYEPANEPGTVADARLAIPVACSPTTSMAVGSACNIDTSVDALMPGFARERARTVVSAFDFRLKDPGADTDVGGGSPNCPPACGTGDERVFLGQGLFLP